MLENIYTLYVDENGYYSLDDTGNVALVKEMPVVSDVKQLFAYRYNPETQLMEVDETKLAEINNKIENPPVTITPEERLADLENAFLELSTMMLGGM